MRHCASCWLSRRYSATSHCDIALDTNVGPPQHWDTICIKFLVNSFFFFLLFFFSLSLSFSLSLTHSRTNNNTLSLPGKAKLWGGTGNELYLYQHSNRYSTYYNSIFRSPVPTPRVQVAHFSVEIQAVILLFFLLTTCVKYACKNTIWLTLHGDIYPSILRQHVLWTVWPTYSYSDYRTVSITSNQV